MQQNGIINYTEYNKTQNWNKREGWSETRHFRGDYNALASQANQFVQGDSGSVSNINLAQPSPASWAELNVDYKVDLTTVWTLDYAQIDQSIFYCPTFLAFLSDNGGSLDKTQLNFLVKGLQYARDYQLAIAELQTALRGYQFFASFKTAYDLLTAGEKATLQLVLDEYNKGNDTFIVTQPMLTKTWLVNWYSNQAHPFDTRILWINSVITRANLNTYFGPIPDQFLQLIPVTGYWIILPARSEVLSNGKFAFSQQFNFVDDYSRIAYTIVP